MQAFDNIYPILKSFKKNWNNLLLIIDFKKNERIKRTNFHVEYYQMFNDEMKIYWSLRFNLQATICDNPAQALKFNLLWNVLCFDRFLLFNDGHQITLQRPVVFLDPLIELFIINISKQFRKVIFLDSLEGGSNNVTNKFANRVLW